MGESKIAYQCTQMQLTVLYDQNFNGYVVPLAVPIFIKERLKAEDYVNLKCSCGCNQDNWVIKAESFNRECAYFKKKRLEDLN